LLDKELGFEKETGKFKIGDGIHPWSELPYANEGVGRAIEDGGEIFGDYNSNMAFGRNSIAEGEYTQTLKNA
jgi:hypothetical protein